MKLRILCVCFGFGVALCLWGWRTWQTWNSLQLVFCDVGQGDAVLLSYRSQQLLYDAGPDRKVLNCLRQNLPWWDKQLEVVIASHPDADHIGGFEFVWQQYQVKTFIHSPDFKPTETYNRLFLAVAKAKESGQTQEINHPFLGQSITISSRVRGKIVYNSAYQPDFEGQSGQDGDSTEKILWDKKPVKPEAETNSNDRSIMLFLELDGVEVLLTGDAQEHTEQALLDRRMIHKVDVLKVGHHGSKSSSSAQFLAELQPELSVISVGVGNRFGHPHPEVLSRLELINSRVLRTDEEGSVKLTISGDSFQLAGQTFF